jgi:hypothetical protein
MKGKLNDLIRSFNPIVIFYDKPVVCCGAENREKTKEDRELQR